VFWEHDTGPWHPERAARLGAVAAGARAAGLEGELAPVTLRPASRPELERAHAPALLDALERLAAVGGGPGDADTVAAGGPRGCATWAAGAGLAAIEALDRGEGEAAFCAVRPPGHHARPTQSMGFCLVNNVAVAAAALAERGERVLVVD